MWQEPHLISSNIVNYVYVSVSRNEEPSKTAQKNV